MLLTCFPVKSFASNVIPNPQSDNPLKINKTEKPTGKIVKEIVNKREKNVKQYLLDDGTYQAAI